MFGKKSPLLFLSLPAPPTSSSWCPGGYATSVPKGVARGGKAHKGGKVTLSFQPCRTIDRVWWRRKKAKAWPGAVADFYCILLTQTHRAVVSEKMASFTCCCSAKGSSEILKQLTKTFEATLFSSLILEQSQQSLTSSFRRNFFYATNEKCWSLQIH